MQSQNAIYLELSVESEGASVFVRSRHVPGLHLIGSNFQAMKPMVETAIKMLFRDNRQMEVNVIWLTEYGVDAVCNVLERLAVVPVDQTFAAA